MTRLHSFCSCFIKNAHNRRSEYFLLGGDHAFGCVVSGIDMVKVLDQFSMSKLDRNTKYLMSAKIRGDILKGRAKINKLNELALLGGEMKGKLNEKNCHKKHACDGLMSKVESKRLRMFLRAIGKDLKAGGEEWGRVDMSVKHAVENKIVEVFSARQGIGDSFNNNVNVNVNVNVNGKIQILKRYPSLAKEIALDGEHNLIPTKEELVRRKATERFEERYPSLATAVDFEGEGGLIPTKEELIFKEIENGIGIRNGNGNANANANANANGYDQAMEERKRTERRKKWERGGLALTRGEKCELIFEQSKHEKRGRGGVGWELWGEECTSFEC